MLELEDDANVHFDLSIKHHTGCEMNNVLLGFDQLSELGRQLQTRGEYLARLRVLSTGRSTKKTILHARWSVS